MPDAKAVDLPLPNGGAARNAVPVYAAPNQAVTAHFVPEMPIRTSALRTLGGFFNAVSAEMFVDELAMKINKDPVAFRLANVKDPRLVAVTKKVVEMSGWTPRVGGARTLQGEVKGTGIGITKYKNSDAYVAIVAQVAVDTASGKVRVEKMWSAVDTGRMINPDGVRNQIDGGIVQATSWTLIEGGRWDHGIMTTVDYADYPIIDYLSTPLIETALIDQPGLPPLGVGEGSQAPAGAAIANAILDATGKRVPSLPFTPERVLAALKA